jgi:hypothetical protein
LQDAEFRHGLLDPSVTKKRVKVYGRGVYVDVAELETALRERDARLRAEDLDRYIARIGGHRVERGRFLHVLGLRKHRRAEYFLPELAFQRVRQSPENRGNSKV